MKLTTDLYSVDSKKAEVVKWGGGEPAPPPLTDEEEVDKYLNPKGKIITVAFVFVGNKDNQINCEYFMFI